jgi:integrase
MRYKEPFTLYQRKSASGKKIWYYRTYDQNNNRLCGHSTGKISKTAARQYCYELYKADGLIPEKINKLTFNEYSKNWWVWDKCEYLNYQRSIKKISRSYSVTARGMLVNHLLPALGKKELTKINDADIRALIASFTAKGLSKSTAVLGFKFVKIMFNEAIRKNIIKSNPTDAIKGFKQEGNPRGILTKDEISKIFDSANKNELWDNEIYYLGNLLSACTGMRISEVLAVRGETLLNEYIFVNKQVQGKYGLCDTKSHEVRNVVLPAELYKKLKEIKIMNAGGFLFSIDGGKTPVGGSTLRDSLYSALRNIGIDEEKRKERKLCFHSWRHYLNTTLRSNNISDGKLRALIGHTSSAMTEHYTHFNTEDFKDIQKVQSNIMKFVKAG